MFLINCQWDLAELEHHLNAEAKRYIAKNNIQLYTINAIDLAIKVGMGKRTNTILQSAFFSLAKVMPEADAIKYMKDAAEHSYAKKGMDVVEKNWNAIDAGATAYVKVDVPAAWAEAEDQPDTTVLEGKPELVKMVKNILLPIDKMDGDSLPVSTFMDHVDGQFELGASAYEKRGVAVTVPEWDADKCIQCNSCAFVCPHATIRPFALTEEEPLPLPPLRRSVRSRPARARASISTPCCLPARLHGLRRLRRRLPDEGHHHGRSGEPARSAAGLQLHGRQGRAEGRASGPERQGQPVQAAHARVLRLLRSCAETSYARLITQLFGDRMYISNATGCSSIWGGPGATSPYCTDKNGHGPAWSNSLFEDNAEHGYGMYTAQKVIRENLAEKTHALLAIDWTAAELKEAAQKWLDTMEDALPTRKLPSLHRRPRREHLRRCDCDACKLASEILSQKDYLSKKSVWIFGGDGWAYDIGFGGVDHVLAQNEDVNIFVFDTEVYSNTGGQASKASNIGQVAQFAAAGKETKKKSLAEIAMSYGTSTSRRSQWAPTRLRPSRPLPRPSLSWPVLIIGYAPCEMHSIKGGMMHCQEEMKKAVDCGYWNMFRFDPSKETGKFTLDSKQPKGGYQEFLMNEARYSRLTREFPERANELFERNEESAKARYEHLLKLVEMYKD